MKRSLVFLLVSFVLILTNSRCWAQNPSYSLTFSQNQNQYNWIHSFALNQTISDRLSISGSTNFNSFLYKSSDSSVPNRWRDNNGANLAITQQFSDKVSLSFNSFFSKGSDNISKGQSVTTGSFGSSLNFKPFQSLRMTQAIGQALDRRRNINDSGMSYSLGVNVNPNIAEKTPDLSFSYNKSGNTLKRKDLNSSISASSRYKFSWGLGTNLSFTESRRKENYYSAGAETKLENRFTNGRNFSLGFNMPTLKSFPILNNLEFSSSTGYSTNLVDDSANNDSLSSKFQTNSKGWNFNFGSSLRAKIFGILPVTYETSYRKYIEDYIRSRLDRNTVEFSMSLATGFGVTGRDTLIFAGSVTKRSYDTPDPNEYNDNDEFKSYFKVTYQRQFTSGLRMTVDGSTNQNHTVYLFGQMSINNRWTRNYSLQSSLNYDPTDVISLSQRYYIYASYDEYDFDLIEYRGPLPKSRVSRSLSVDNSANWKATRKLNLSTRYGFRKEDYGDLYEDGSQLVAEDRSQNTFGLSTSYYATSKFSFSSGYNQQNSKRWRHLVGERKLDYDETLKTASINLSYTPSSDNTLSFSGSRTKRYKNKLLERKDDYITVTYNHKF